MGSRRIETVLLAALLSTVSSVASADPAGEVSFVPVGLVANRDGASVVVERGDHLWKISQTHLDQMLGRRASADEVDPFWRSVIDANLGRLQSGDPDLIYPGEVVALPPSG
jgi:nucleoid-associated protein YgaU